MKNSFIIKEIVVLHIHAEKYYKKEIVFVHSIRNFTLQYHVLFFEKVEYTLKFFESLHSIKSNKINKTIFYHYMTYFSKL